MHRFFGVLLLMVLLVSCRQHPDTVTRISGKLADLQGMQLVLLEMGTNAMHVVDSVVPDPSGVFGFQFQPEEAGFWLLRVHSGKVLVLVVNPGDEITLSGSGRNFPDMVTLIGPAEATALHAFYAGTRREEKLVDSLESELALHQDEDDYYAITRKADTVFRQIWERQRERETQYIKTNPGYLSSLVVLNYAFGMSPVLGPDDDFDLYMKLDSTLSKSFPANKHVQYHHRRLQEHRRNNEKPVQNP